MKKLIILITSLLILSTLAFTQKKEKESEPSIIYSLPKTILVLEVDATKITQTVGPYYKYSERYLALKEKDIITEDKTYWEITNIKLKTKAVADKNKTFSVKAGDINFICLNKSGLISGINTPCTNASPSKTVDIPNQNTPANQSLNASTIDFDNMVLTEDQLVANSTLKMAESAAKQIYRIRDSRISLITGENDKTPADGESLKLMLKNLDLAEKSLVELFAGKKSMTTIKKEIEIVPDKNMKGEVVFRLSAINGIVDKDDLSGKPILLSISTNKTDLPSTSLKGESSFFYNIPMKAKVEITYGDSKFVDEEVSIAQFGSTQAIPQKVLKKGNAKVYYEAETGALLSIEK